MRRWADKRDGNERPIINYLERVGCVVKQISQKAVPDLMVSQGPLGMFIIHLEVKNKNGNLTDDQKVFFKAWGNSFCYVVYSIDDVKNVLRLFMPVRIYKCDTHGMFEKKQAFSDDPLTKCPKCDNIVRQVYTVPFVVYKGTGWAGKDIKN